MAGRSASRRWGATLGIVVAVLAMLGAEVALPAGPAGAASASSADPTTPTDPTTATDPQPDDPRIVGGEVAPPGTWPSQVALVRAGRTPAAGIFCGGTLVGRTWVLTAAHCLDGGTRPSDVDVLVGTQDLRVGGTRIKAVQLWVHPDWNPATSRNDVGMIRLDHPAPPSIPFQAIADPAISPTAGQEATVAGWGVTVEGSRQTVPQLRQVTLDVSTSQACAAGNPGTYHQPTMVCAARAGKDSCQGDSGGPLLAEHISSVIQMGIVSTGIGCARPGHPGVYTKVGPFRVWIGNRLRFGPHPDAFAFVDRTYLDAFGRKPTPAESYTSLGALSSKTPAAVAADVVDSDAFDDRAGAVVRLYQAVFRRRPDTAGLAFWWQRVNGGTSAARIADQMVAAPEFQQTYGSLSDADFVDLVYENVLGRTPSAADRGYWVGELQSGRRTRGRVMVGFSESPEYRQRTAGPTRVIAAFYMFVRRVPTAGEVTEWQSQPTSYVVRGLLDSYGYANRF